MTSEIGFTKTGYPTSGFSCCSYHQHCSLGKTECYHEKLDPAVKNYCRCYQRNHCESINKKNDQRLGKRSTTTIRLITQEKNEGTNKHDVEGQLSLF